MKKLILFLPLIFSIFIFSCKDDAEDEMPTIADLAVSADLDSLVVALSKAGLVSTFQGEGTFTVFGPTNQAFVNLLASNASWNKIDDIPTATLDAVLKFHVLGSVVRSTELSDSYANTLSTGPNGEAISLQITTTGAVKFNGSANPVSTDNMASNGIVHVIDEVMLPPAIPNFALNNPSFSILVAALTDSRHSTTTPVVDYVGILSGTGPFTVFAPTDEAFIALLNSNADWNGLGDIPIETLQAVLNYHVVAGANVQSDELTNGQEITMFSGDMLTVNLSNGAQLSTSGGQDAVDIVLTDVQGTNGVIHVVNEVLLP